MAAFSLIPGRCFGSGSGGRLTVHGNRTVTDGVPQASHDGDTGAARHLVPVSYTHLSWTEDNRSILT